ncbi:flagellar motor protein [Clostridium estertheticum]|uniref:Flagellar motor protein n=1 Tax=Clostridium estertheticum TaxID=238834 RepID=A0AA47I4G2_9CLOT|nr:flagellar motor protein [Clostridium estertheticum]MBU3156144.1 flagellar motor protein [Clostridium estertheticum]MBU3199375.1 flagellar motor protein [Clostridium estertheticum]WAG58583.1 flagellar motor protein [Clostridium estertheticum]WAG67381.1 flagellar motor protein [Clostridium estertheticum]
MNIYPILFIILSFGSLIAAFILEGGSPVMLVAKTAAMIVFGGTIGSVGLASSPKRLKNVPAMIKLVFTSKDKDLVEIVNYFKQLSFKTRKEGLLSIEGEITDDLDPFIKKGLQLVVDGVDPQMVKTILEFELESTYDRHKENYAVFEAAGGFAPTMGVIGTVMGLVQVLSNLADPSVLGEKIATAFIATLYGVGSANLFFLPIGVRLKDLNNEESKEKELIIEAVLLMQEGANPNILAEKLKGFLDKTQIKKFNEMNNEVEK